MCCSGDFVRGTQTAGAVVVCRAGWGLSEKRQPLEGAQGLAVTDPPCVLWLFSVCYMLSKYLLITKMK